MIKPIACTYDRTPIATATTRSGEKITAYGRGKPGAIIDFIKTGLLNRTTNVIIITNDGKLIERGIETVMVTDTFIDPQP